MSQGGPWKHLGLLEYEPNVHREPALQIQGRDFQGETEVSINALKHKKVSEKSKGENVLKPKTIWPMQYGFLDTGL